MDQEQSPPKHSMKKDPANYPWVWWVFLALGLAWVPWPFNGTVHDIPLWALIALGMNVLVSAFVVYVIFKVWSDSGNSGEEDADGPH